ncbi:hypothetical protein GCM10023115_23660 [Pontixanthobacter gangjinensis]|uniref:Uroporphyrinogen-III synthase n=1 Tax=Pontixanthobacter gangjinensis TaxID=1028742 RepID=A0A6I4SSV8_9SPHN|nr:uroporphyrinogen-III synthase [Pontixanthobacter gangjinensis]MXO57612.1 uroporphyrinogen-III synthase [Pontixanthobacter gangjinensis]
MSQARTIVCIRPEPGLSDTVVKGRELGLTITGVPLFTIEPLDWVNPKREDFDGILLGSANAIRQGGEQLKHLKRLPAYAVGRTTAKIAQAAGFTIQVVGKGGLQALLDNLPVRPIRLLRLAGEEKIPLSPASWQEIVERIVYRSVALPMPDTLPAILANHAIIALHSASAAEHFASECRRLAIDRGTIAVAALGPRIADAAGDGWAEVAVAAAPDDAALLAMIQNMCK